MPENFLDSFWHSIVGLTISERERGITLKNCLQSFMHIGVFCCLFTIIVLELYGLELHLRKFVRIIPAF